MWNERTLRWPRTPTVPGEPTGIVGSRVSTLFCCSTMIERKALRAVDEQPHLGQTVVVVGQDVDGGGQRRHRKRWVLEDVLHGQTP